MGEAPGEALEPEAGELREHDALAGQTTGEHHVEGADAIRRHDEQTRLAIRQLDVVEVPHLAGTLVGQCQVRCHHGLREGAAAHGAAPTKRRRDARVAVT